MHPEIDRFAELSSPLHRWDARWKLATLLLLMFSMGLARGPGGGELSWERDGPPALAGLLFSLGLVALSSIPLAFVLRKLRAAAFFLFIVLLVYSLRGSAPTDAADATSLAGFSASGFLAGALIVIRAFAMILLIYPAFGTTRFDVSMKALRRLRLPERLVHTILFAYRCLFVSADQERRMRDAMRARGFRPRADLHTLRTIGQSIGVLLLGSVERTQRIHGAMRCRGFRGTFRTLDEFRTRPRDVAMSAVVLTVGAALFGWRFR